MGMTQLTWKHMAQVFAVSLSDTMCSDHPTPVASCPYCRDSAAVLLYQAKLAGRVDATWQEVTTQLARRFQHFEECTTHSAAADVENCPFCRDGDRWRQYVEFCGQQGTRPVRRDADVLADGAVAVSIHDLRGVRKPGLGAR